MAEITKKCPYCGESIPEEAIKCRFCGEPLSAGASRADEDSTSKRSPFNGAWVVAVIAVVSVLLYISIKSESSDSRDSDASTASDSVRKSYAPVERPPITEASVERLSEGEHIITTTITTTGKGEHAKWCLRSSGSFVLTYAIVCRTKIISKEKTSLGDFKVVERRTYEKMRQVLQVSEADVHLAISDCLPMETVAAACSAVAATFGADAASVGAAVESGAKLLDEQSAKRLLSGFSGDLSKELESKVDKFVKSRINEILKTGGLEGKSYLITYFQDGKNGRASNMTFAHEDGSSDLTEEEYLVLRRANAFMDSQLVPDRKSRPGDTWRIDAADFDCLLDPYVDGSYDGAATVMRRKDDPQGNMVLSVDPCVVRIKSKQKTTGNVELRGGQVFLDRETLLPKSIQLFGRGAMQNLTRHHLLFKARLEGKCEFNAESITR